MDSFSCQFNAEIINMHYMTDASVKGCLHLGFFLGFIEILIVLPAFKKSCY
jgi:hypothetical protein